MAENCTSANVPILITVNDPCEGKHMSTECVYSKEAIAYLGLPVNATLKDIITAMIAKMQTL